MSDRVYIAGWVHGYNVDGDIATCTGATMGLLLCSPRVGGVTRILEFLPNSYVMS